nr:MAG TPA: hypothetical protein [Caudoviricetes sp.]DAM21329.1 MAG TPA: hypothetical protein [Caudoviricetes sp.]
MFFYCPTCPSAINAYVSTFCWDKVHVPLLSQHVPLLSHNLIGTRPGQLGTRLLSQINAYIPTFRSPGHVGHLKNKQV